VGEPDDHVAFEFLGRQFSVRDGPRQAAMLLRKHNVRSTRSGSTHEVPPCSVQTHVPRLTYRLDATNQRE
jgi:hypothetical protein